MRPFLGSLLLVIPLAAMAGEGGSGSVEIPDIRANIIQMLQQKGDKTATNGRPTSEPERPRAPDAEDLFEQAREQMQQPPQGDSPAVAPSVESPQAPKKPKAPSMDTRPRSTHVPLPNKSITIEDLDDLEELKWEIDEAKKRQRQE